MKILKWLLTSLLAIVLILSTPLSYAQTTTAPNTFQMPSSEQVVRHIKRIGVHALVLDFAVKQLVEAVDWVLDPENNRVRYTDKSKNEKIYSSSHIKLGMPEHIDSEDFEYMAQYSCQNRYSSNRIYSGQFSQTPHIVNIKCIWADTGHPAGTAAFYKYDKIQHLLLDSVAQQIIQNAKSGHALSQQFVEAVADDIVKQNAKPITSDQANTDAEPTEKDGTSQDSSDTSKTDKSVKTGNPDLDDVFKDAYPQDGDNYSYHIPNKTQAELIEELGGIDGAEVESFQDGSGVNVYIDGWKTSFYPARGSTGKPGWSIFKPGKNRPTYKGDTSK